MNKQRYIAQTILRQIGQRTFYSISRNTARRPVVALDENSKRRGGAMLTLTPGGSHWLWKLQIDLTHLDLYRVRLWKIGNRLSNLGTRELVKEYNGIYNDQLSELAMACAIRAAGRHDN